MVRGAFLNFQLFEDLGIRYLGPYKTGRILIAQDG